MLSEKELLNRGFQKVENTNKFDFYASLKLKCDDSILEFPLEDDEEIPPIFNFSFNEIRDMFHSTKNMSKRKKHFDGFVRVSYIPSSQKAYFSFYFFDGKYCVLNSLDSSIVAWSIISKDDCPYIEAKLHMNDDKQALNLLLGILKKRLSKSFDTETVYNLEDEISNIQHALELINEDLYNFDYFKDSNRKYCEIGVIDGFIILTILNNDEHEIYSEIDTMFVLEVGPKLRDILIFLLYFNEVVEG